MASLVGGLRETWLEGHFATGVPAWVAFHPAGFAGSGRGFAGAPRQEPSCKGEEMLTPIRGYQAMARKPATRGSGEATFSLAGAWGNGASGTCASGIGASRTENAAEVAAQTEFAGIQQEWTPAERDAAARKRGSALLRELNFLQLAMLGRGMEPMRLARLALLAEGEVGDDPALEEIIKAISLRAQVELARIRPSTCRQLRETGG